MRFDCIRCRKATIKPQGVKGAFVRMLTSQKPLTVYQMVRELFNRELIDKKDLEIILSINKLRNIVIHGGNIPKIEKHIDDELKRITQKIIDKSKYSQ